MSDIAAPLLELDGVTQAFGQRSSSVGFGRDRSFLAVDDVSVSIRRGESVGLVGESGCGKTTTARIMLDLIEPTSGDVRYLSQSLASLTRAEYRTYRQDVQAVFQDPATALNPRMRVVDLIAEPLIVAREWKRSAARSRAIELMDGVGLGTDVADRLPHELSGGMKQRVAIAAAFATQPALVVLDEPVSALDMSVRSQIINLLRQTRQETGAGYLIISHDLATIGHMADRILTMYAGRVIEDASATRFLKRPLHPYSIVLHHAATRGPVASKFIGTRTTTVVSSIDDDAGNSCKFSARCWLRARLSDTTLCDTRRPILTSASSHAPHSVACHHVDQVEAVEAQLQSESTATVDTAAPTGSSIDAQVAP